MHWSTLISFVLFNVLCCLIASATIDFGDIDLGCPSSSYRHGNLCFSLSPNLRTTFHSANTICKTSGGKLAQVRDEETLQFLRLLNVRKYMTNFWIGLTDKRHEGRWMFSDGSVLRSNFQRWSPGEPSNHHNKEHCACLWLMRDLAWNDDNCEKEHYYICQFYDSKCPNNSTVHRWQRLCFLFSKTRENYMAASHKCHEMGGMLVVDKDIATHEAISAIIYQDRSWQHLDNDELSDLLQFSDNHHGVRHWIGVKRTSSGDWHYLDGSPVPSDAQFWGDGEPRNASCVTAARNWSTTSCTHERAFFCQYDPEKSSVNLNHSSFDSSSSESKPKCGHPLVVNLNHSSVNLNHSSFDSLSSQSKSKSGLPLSQSVFVLLLLVCFIVGVACATLFTKRHVLKRKLQLLQKRKDNVGDSSLNITTFEASEMA